MAKANNYYVSGTAVVSVVASASRAQTLKRAAIAVVSVPGSVERALTLARSLVATVSVVATGTAEITTGQGGAIMTLLRRYW